MANGYRASTVDELARSFGAGKSTIYARYGSKAGLLHAVMKRAEPVLREPLEGVAADPGRDPRAVLRDFGRIVQDYAQNPKIRAIWRAVSEAREDLGDRLQDVQDASGLTIEPIAAYLDLMRKRGELVLAHPDEAAMCFSEMASGGLSQFLGNPLSPDGQERALETVLDVFLSGCLPRRG